jgi:hypothetical protein
MTASLLAPAAQVCAFALGCALIHAARAHAVAVSRVLTVIAVVMAALALLGASLASSADDDMSLDEITIYNAA